MTALIFTIFITILFNHEAQAKNLKVFEASGPIQLGKRNALRWIDYRRLNLYAGLGWIRSQNTEEEVRAAIEGDLGGNLNSFGINQNRIGGHFGLGYEITDNFHLELMYFNFGRVNVESSTTGFAPGSLETPMSNHLPWTGAGPLFALKFNTWVMNPYHRIFTRLGLIDWKSSYDIAGEIAINRQGQDLVGALGYEYFYKKGRSIRAEMVGSKVGQEFLLSIGAAYVIYFDGIPREPMPVPKRTHLKEKIKDSDDHGAYLSKIKETQEISKIELLKKNSSNFVLNASSPKSRNLFKPDNLPPFLILGALREILNITVYFDFNSDSIKKSEEEKLKQLNRYMNRHQKGTIVLTGHTDAVGPKDYNMNLSKRRVLSVENYLFDLGLEKKRIKNMKFFGKQSPTFKNNNRNGRQKNRRVHVCVTTTNNHEKIKCQGKKHYESLENALLDNFKEVESTEGISLRTNKLRKEESNKMHQNSLLSPLKIKCSRVNTEYFIEVKEKKNSKKGKKRQKRKKRKKQKNQKKQKRAKKKKHEKEKE